MKLIFAHGLEGSPEGEKVVSMRAAGFDVLAPDCRRMPLAQRIAVLDELTAGGGVLLAGSSYGGVAVAILAERHPERFTGLCLLAPALLIGESPATGKHRAPVGLPTVIIHGVQDEICKLEGSVAYAARSGPHVTLREVDDGHRLTNSHAVIIETLKALGA